MRRIYRIGLGLAVAATVTVGCGDEDPVATGSDLLGEGLRTVHVVLDAAEFMQNDTTYDSFGSLNRAQFGVVANDFEGELDANILFQLTRPFQVTYEDPEGNTRTDSLAAIRGGTLTVVVDSLTAVDGPVEFSVLDVTEAWDPTSASWTHRVDTAGTSELWTSPGGTTGSVLGTGTWSSGDTLVIPMDSATASVWHDSTAAARGGALQLTTAGERLRIQTVNFAFDIEPTGTDTVMQGGSVSRRLTVASPDTDPAGTALRVGGLPAWRSAIQFLPLAEVEVPCESGATGCTLPLEDVTVSAANLVLRTQAAGGRRPERPMRLEGRAILQGPGVPLTRSPLTGSMGRMEEEVEVSAFAGAALLPVRVPITGYVKENVSTAEDEDPTLWMALTAVFERSLFGYGQFGSLASTTPPQLELVVTIPVRKVP